jgi:outer membrane protein
LNANTLSKLSIAVSTVALIGMVVSFVTKAKSTATLVSKHTPATTGAKPANAQSTVAYVDIDTLEANYIYFKNKKAEFANRQQSIESELQRSQMQLQSQAAEYQKKGSSGGFASQAEVDAAGRKLGQMEQSLKTRGEALAKSLLKDQDAFNAEIQKRLDEFLEAYVQDKPYDYVLSYSKSGSILYANKSLDITRDVIAGMNAKLQDTAK